MIFDRMIYRTGYRNSLIQLAALEARHAAEADKRATLVLARLYRKHQMFSSLVRLLSDTHPNKVSVATEMVPLLVQAHLRLGHTDEARDLIFAHLEANKKTSYRLRLAMAECLAPLFPDRALNMYRSVELSKYSFTQLMRRLRLSEYLVTDASEVRIISNFAVNKYRKRHPVDVRALEIRRSWPVQFRSVDPLKSLEYSDFFAMYNRTVSETVMPKRYNSGPVVSVIVTCFNTGPLLEISISSLLRQSHERIEIIIVDDCSTDTNTLNILDHLRARDPRIRLFSTPSNMGTYVAKNMAIREASGEYVTFHDSDDWAHPSRISGQLVYLRRYPWLKATQSHWIKVQENGYPVLKSWGVFAYKNPASLMVRRQVFDAIGDFDCVRIGADSEFNARVRLYYGDAAFKEIRRVWTLGVQRDQSLTSEGLGAIDIQGINGPRAIYEENWRRWHLECAKDDVRVMIKRAQREGRPFALPRQFKQVLFNYADNLSLRRI